MCPLSFNTFAAFFVFLDYFAFIQVDYSFPYFFAARGLRNQGRSKGEGLSTAD